MKREFSGLHLPRGARFSKIAALEGARFPINEINFCEIPPQWSQRGLSPHGVRTKCSDSAATVQRPVALTHAPRERAFFKLVQNFG